MTTASAWKNFRRAFRLRVGTRRSAASSHSLAPSPRSVGRCGIATVGNIAETADDVSDADASPNDPDPPGVVGSLSGCVAAPPSATGSLPVGSRGRKRRERAICRLHAQTLIPPSTDQYARSAGRVHRYGPSSSQNTTHNHGSRPRRSHRTHVPISPPTMSPAPR